MKCSAFLVLRPALGKQKNVPVSRGNGKWQYFSSHPEVGADQLADRIDGSQLVACSAVDLPAAAPKIPLERSLGESKHSIASLPAAKLTTNKRVN
jgi:hypothetical protein